MINRRDYLLSKLSEECAEVIQRVEKARQFGLDEIQEGQSLNNRERIEQEVYDLRAVLNRLVEEGILHSISDRVAYNTKNAKLEKWWEYIQARNENEPT